MFRWFDELLHPAKACERKGHKMREWSRRIYLYPPESLFRSVADKAIERGSRCKRCGHEADPKLTDRTGLTGLTLNGDGWDRLEAEGRYAP